jgi:hypothetical protein
VASKEDVKLAAELKALTQQRVDLEKQIVEQKSKMESAEKKSIENIKKLVTLEALRMDSVEKEEEVRKKIEKLDKDTEDRQKKSEKYQKETADRSKKETEEADKKAKKEKDRLDLADQTRALSNEQKKINADIGASLGIMNDKTKSFAQELQKGNDAGNTSVDYWNNIANSIEKGYNTSTQFESNLKDVKSINGDISDLYQESVAQTGEIEKGTAKIINTDKAREAIAKKRYQIEKDGSGLSAADQQTLLKGLDFEEQRLTAIENQNKVIEKQTAKVGMINDIGSQLGTSMSSWVTKIPGGEAIYKMLGIDKTAEKMNNSFTNAIQNGLKGNFKTAFAEGAKGLGSMIAMGPKLVAGLGLGALTGGFGLLAKGAKGLFNVLMEVDGEIAQMGKDFAMSKKEAGELYKNTSRMANEMKITGINSKEIAVGIDAASQAMGGMDVAGMINAGNKEMEAFAKQATVLTKQFGLSGDEVAKIKDLSIITGTSMDNLVKDAVGVGKGVMNAKEAMKTLAGVPKEVAVGFKGSSKELVAAAQKAKMLGMDLKKVKDIGRGMLDLESSLTAEFEAQALTGKNLNLSAARRYALEGDVYNLQEELLSQAGSLKDFQSMNVIQQESMAKAMGMSVEEMTTMLTNAEKLKDAKIDATMAENLSKMNAKELAEAAKGAANDKQKAYIEELAAQKRSASLQEAMTDAVEKLKQKFAPVIDAVLDIVGGLEEGNDGVSVFQKMIDGIDMEAIAAGVKEALPKLMEAVQTLIKRLPQIIEFVTKIVGGFASAGGAVGGLMGFINPSVAGIGAMALKVAGPGGVAAGFKLAGKGAMGLFDMVKGPLGDSIGKLAGGVTDKLGGAFGKVSEKAGALGSKMKDMAADKAGDLGGKSKKAKMPKGGKGGGGFMDGIVNAVNKMDTKKMIQGAAAILILAAALFVTAKAVQEFMKVDWGAMAKAGVALLGLAAIAYLMGKASTEMIKGAAAMLILGAALYVIGLALQFFVGIKWEDMAKAGVALLGLIAVAAILGAAAPLFLAGAVVLAALSGALLIFGAALYVIGAAAGQVGPLLQTFFEGLNSVISTVGGAIVEIVNTIASAIYGFIDRLLKLGEMDPGQLLSIAAGITALAGALAAFGGGSGIGAALEGLGSLFGGDSPFDMLMSLVKEVDPSGLLGIATGVMMLSTALGTIGDNLGKIDTSKLDQFKDSLGNLMQSLGGGAIMEGIGSILGGESPLSTMQKLIASLEPEKLSAVAKSLLEISTSLKTLADTIAGMDVEKLGQVFEKINQSSGESKVSKVMDSIVGGITSMFGGDEEKEGEQKSAGGNVSTPAATAVSPVGMQSAAFSPAMAAAAMNGAAVGPSAGAGGGGGANMGGVEGKLDQLISLMSQAASQPVVIKFGDKFIEEIRSTINIKQSYQVDQTFGRTA